MAIIKTSSLVAELIRTFRKKNGFSQTQLAKKMGLYFARSKSNSNIISLYERGNGFPSIPNIYKLSQFLVGLDKDVLFNAVLKEHYERFLERHYSRYVEWEDNGDEVLNRSLIYNFICASDRRFKIKYSFKKFTKILKEAKQKKEVTYDQMLKNFITQDNIKSKYHKSYLAGIMQGHRPASLKMVINFATYFNLDAFELYKIFVKEKALSHAKNMMEQWELFKEEADNAEENIKT